MREEDGWRRRRGKRRNKMEKMMDTEERGREGEVGGERIERGGDKEEKGRRGRYWK